MHKNMENRKIEKIKKIKKNRKTQNQTMEKDEQISQNKTHVKVLIYVCIACRHYYY